MDQAAPSLDRKKRKQLHECIKKHDLDQIKILLEEKLDLNTMVNKVLPLVLAASKGKVEIVEMLLKAGADPNKCETVYDNLGGLYINRCALHECPCLGEKGIEMAKLLLANGADVDLLDDEGTDILEKAILYNNIKMIDLLFDNGFTVNRKNPSGEMPLHHACLDSTVEVVEHLLNLGADLNPIGSHAPLLLAADRGRTDMVKYLLSKGANPNHKDSKGHTPFLQACYRGIFEIVKILVENGADIQSCSNNGDTCLHFLCYQYPNKTLLNYLVNHGADMYAKNNDGKTAFSMVCLLARTDAVIALLGAGFDIQKEEHAHPGICLQIIAMLPAIRLRTHPKKVMQMAELLVAMGYCVPNVGSIKEIRKMVNATETATSVCDWLMEQRINVKPLKNLTRLYLRHNLGNDVNIDKKIEALPLPSKIKEFLKFEDAIKHESENRCLGCNEYMDECECQADDYDYYDDYQVDWGSPSEGSQDEDDE